MIKPFDDGGPAFPRSISDGMVACAKTHEDMQTLVVATRGMSLRDWFAGRVLTGLYACGRFHSPPFSDVDAKEAYRVADILIEARKVKP